MPYFSLIIPVYNRPDEVQELLDSLVLQTEKDFEVVIIEDGSPVPCKYIVDQYTEKLNILYLQKPNSGRSYTRNYGMERANGDYFIFFDSDCIIPPHYFETVKKNLQESYSDCFGGPDNALDSFSDMQKAINYSMTSFFTTGGIRGGNTQMEKFKPRTFNMGFSRQVYEKVGAFNNMFGEDIDLVLRIEKAGFSIVLYKDAYVYHKRRVDLKKFFKQVNQFGIGRINLSIIHPGSMKLVHTLPAVFTLGCALLILLSFWKPYFFDLILLYALLIFLDAHFRTKSIKIAGLAVITSFVQLWGYGLGFLKAFWEKKILGKSLENDETMTRIYK